MSGLGLILPRANQFPWVETVPAYAVLGSSAPGANFLLVHRITRLSEPLGVSQVKLEVATQNGNVDVGVYSSDGSTLTKLGSSGSTAVGSANAVQTIALSASITLQPGVDYYLALIVDGTAAFARSNGFTHASIGAADNMSLTKSVTFPLPSTSTIGSLSGIHLAYWLRAS